MNAYNDLPVYSVVVPVFESGPSVERLVERTADLFERRLKVGYEIILVDDGSRNPRTWATLRALAKARRQVSALRLMRNYGKPAAVLCGLAQARGRWVVTLDDDLQQRPEDIAQLVKHQAHDVVVAIYPRKHHSLAVRLASAVKGRFDRHVLGLPCRMSPLKLIARPVVEEMLKVRAGRPYIPALLAHATSDFKPVELEHRASEAGASRYTFGRRLRQFSNLIISNSGFLLRATGIFGALVLTVGVGLAGYLLTLWLAGAAALSGWQAVIAVNLVLGGAGLLGLGFMGEYLIRIVELASDKPPYAIRETAGVHEKEFLRLAP